MTRPVTRREGVKHKGNVRESARYTQNPGGLDAVTDIVVNGVFYARLPKWPGLVVDIRDDLADEDADDARGRVGSERLRKGAAKKSAPAEVFSTVLALIRPQGDGSGRTLLVCGLHGRETSSRGTPQSVDGRAGNRRARFGCDWALAPDQEAGR